MRARAGRVVVVVVVVMWGRQECPSQQSGIRHHRRGSKVHLSWSFH